ncbi:MAG: oligosaccharide repeat unit polymerase [Acidobacteriota bacterium]|nr:oligosaccharide repeat unit polymerase [Acidobacteriota bacterium]
MSNETFFVAFYLLCALLLASVTAAAVVEWKTRNPALLFWLALLAIYVVPCLRDPFNPYAFILEHRDGKLGWGLDLRFNPVLLRAQLFAIGFVLFYLLTKAALYRTERRAAAASGRFRLKESIARLSRTSSMSGLTTTVLLIGLALAGYSVVAVHGFAGVLESGYQSYYMESFTPAKLLSDYVFWAFGGSAFVAWSRRRYGLLCVIVAIFLSQFAMSMARGVWISVATPFVLHVLFRRWSLRNWIRIIAGGGLAYTVIVLMLLLRFEGGLLKAFDALASPRFYNKVTEQLQAGQGEARRRVGYYFFMQEGIEYEGFATGQSFRRLLMLPIPSAWAGSLKPRPITERQYDRYYGLEGVRRSNQSAGQLPTLVFGSAYANFGWFGMVVGAFWAGLFGFFSVKIKRASPVDQALYYGALGNLLLFASRGAIYNAVARMFWASLIVFLTLWAWRQVQRHLRPKAGGNRVGLSNGSRADLTPTQIPQRSPNF